VCPDSKIQLPLMGKHEMCTLIVACCSADRPGTFIFLHIAQWRLLAAIRGKATPQPSFSLSRPPQGTQSDSASSCRRFICWWERVAKLLVKECDGRWRRKGHASLLGTELKYRSPSTLYTYGPSRMPSIEIAWRRLKQATVLPKPR
jgi:hypothetical protein